MIEIRNAGRVKLLVTDVDGVMTDGGMYFGVDGQIMKRFDAKDGLGLKMLQRSGVKVAWLTADKSAITQARFQALELDMMEDGKRPKPEALPELVEKLGCTLEDVVYVGDDMTDIGLVDMVPTFICPADAACDVLEQAHCVAERDGGHGAVREVCEAIMKHNQRFG